jgi:hypothetical protein
LVVIKAARFGRIPTADVHDQVGFSDPIQIPRPYYAGIRVVECANQANSRHIICMERT